MSGLFASPVPGLSVPPMSDLSAPSIPGPFFASALLMLGFFSASTLLVPDLFAPLVPIFFASSLLAVP